MSNFIQTAHYETENGEIVDTRHSPIIEVKKLNGQGTIYKLTDANIESINAERESNRKIDIEKFVRAVRSNFGTGHYTVGAITHTPMPDILKDMGMIRTEVNSKVMVTSSQYHFDEVLNYSIYIYTWDDIVLELDSWHDVIKKAYDDGEVKEQFVELCDMVVEQAPAQISHFLDDTMFDQHFLKFDKISVVRDRVYT